ncbi:hypothetical protein D049_1796A, partial [Vibrio parahaemolyticus VPTS-2010]
MPSNTWPDIIFSSSVI